MRLRRLFISLVFAAVLGTLGAHPAAAQPPSNDTFPNATQVSSLPFADTLDTTEATTDSDDAEVLAACGVSVPVAATVWYAYTPPTDQIVAIQTSGSSYFVGVGVVTGAPGSFSAVTCVSSGTFAAVAGQTYYFDVADISGGNGGTLNLSITAPTPPTVDIDVDRFGHFDPDTGLATVTGTGTCTDSPSGVVFVTLNQRKDQVVTQGFGFVDLPCDGTEHAWSVEVVPVSGQFKGGHADAFVDASACNLAGCAFDHIDRTIVLRGGPPGP